MKMSPIGILLALLIASSATADAGASGEAHGRALTAVTPIAKVLELLQDMATKGRAEKEAEAERFAAFSQWCSGTSRVKTGEIKVATERLEMLGAEKQKSEARIRDLSSRIQELEEDVGRWTKDQASTSSVRTKEAADYRATSTDYTESLDALDGAIAVLKKQAHDRPQTELVQALLQVRGLRLLPAAPKAALAAFLQQAQPDVEMPDDDLFNKSPEAYAYEFQSGGVVDMLEKLKQQFSTKKYELDREELTAQHAFEQIAQQLADSIENAKHEISGKTTSRAESQQAKAEAEGSITQTTTDREEDQKYLDESTQLCTTKKTDFESRQKLRAEELGALAKAIEIISGETVAGTGEKNLPALLQIHNRGGSVSLAQLRSGLVQSPLQARIATFLADRAQTCNSRLLLLASQRVASDPFTKVKKMIKDLIVKLMEESTAETEHKGWCDTELTTNKQTRDAKTAEVNKLTAEKEELTSEIVQLTQDIEDLTTAIAELDAGMATATQERTDSNAKNEETIQEAKEAQTAVEQAIAILKDFYASSAQATALVQQSPAEDAPETFEKPYKGMLPEGGSVVDFLEVILTDFTRLEAETATSEAMELEQYKKYMFESKKDKALKENEKGHKSAKKSDKETALSTTEADLKTTQDELDKAVVYFEKLKPTCVDSGITYEERVKRREAEMQSLQEALKILAGTDIDLA
mmetsp:Transcript_116682/g.238673  ORF Transcript_116682/g.238673 Transcript_116682/m.238673 type:complete len:698 (+) Transcript_116682:88-2181(+)